MPGAYLRASHTAREDGGTDSAMRKCVPRPSAIAPARCHVPYCALRAGTGCGGRAKHGGCAPRRRPGPPAYNQGDSAADHVVLGAAECHRAMVKPGLNRDSLAPVSLIANGMPDPSQIKWCLLPRLALSVGFCPVCSPQKSRAPNNCRPQHANSRFGHHVKASSAMRNGSNPKFRPAANPADAASRSCRSRNPVLSAASAKECHFAARKLCRQGKSDPSARSATLRLGQRNWDKGFDQTP